MPPSLVQWEGLPIEESIKVSDNDLRNIFIDTHLEGKVTIEGEGIDAIEGLNGSELSAERIDANLT